VTERAARVRLLLSNASFIGGLQQIAKEGQEVGKKLASALKEPTVAALSKTRESLKESVGQAKSLAEAAIGIAGGFSVAAGAHGAASLEDTYRRISFAVEQATGQATKWQDVQKMIEPAADAAKRSSAEMAEVFDTLREKSGNVEYSAKALAVVGEAMNGTKRSGAELANIVGVLHKKWGISDMGQVREALLQIFEATKGGKIRFEELAEDLDELGSIAQSAALTGVDGFRKSLGLAAAVAPSVNQSISEVLTGMDQLTEKVRQMPVVKGLAEAGGFQGKKFFDDFVDQPDAFKRVQMLLTEAAKKGKLSQFLRTATEEEFTGREERSAFMALSAPFIEAFETAKDAGASTKTATEEATRAFEANIARMGQTTQSWVAIQDRAADNQNSISTKLAQAQEEFQRAFTDPKTMAAMSELAKKLPQFAEGLAKVISMTVDHPLLAGATLVGGRAALAGATSFVGAGSSAALKGLAEKLTEEVGRTKKTVKRGVFDDFNRRIGQETVEVDVKGGKFANVARIAGQAFGVAAAAVMAYEMGKALIDATMGDSQKKRNDAENSNAVGMAVAETGDRAGKIRALEEARRQQKELEKGPGMVESFFGGIANVVTGGDVKTAGEMNANARAVNKRVIADLEESLARSSEGGTRAGQSMDRLAATADKVTRVLDRFGATASSNGLPPPAKGAAGWE